MNFTLILVLEVTDKRGKNKEFNHVPLCTLISILNTRKAFNTDTLQGSYYHVTGLP